MFNDRFPTVWILTARVLVGSLVVVWGSRGFADEAEDHFEKRIRPLLLEHCAQCHSGETPKGKLRLDGTGPLVGQSGLVVSPGRPDESLLIRAIRAQPGAVAMPPKDRLSESQTDELVAWVKRGAFWPGDSPSAAGGAPTLQAVEIPPLEPNAGSLADTLQLWLSASDLALADGDKVFVWPDRSGRGRDVSATRGVRPDGVGQPGTFVRESRIQRRPAVRFDPETGLAASPGNPVPIQGDAAVSLAVVVNLTPHEVGPPFDCVLCVGNPAHTPGDPGRPLAALIQINRGEDHALHFAGGWNHDATLGSGSFKPWYGQSVILTIVKTPGPMRATTRIYLNGERVGPPQLEGRDTVPDLQHRSDIGMFLGRAVSWAGRIQGDVSEALVYSQALSEAERLGIESYLAGKYGLTLKQQELATRAKFTPEELGHWAYQPVRSVEPPVVANTTWNASPIDRFVFSRMEAAGLTPALPADRRTLLRRVTYGLTGLPPTPAELDAFEADTAPGAYERVVDRLLKSPHYGEQWGRHWLDVVRFAESTANDANAVMRFAWRYRNYVIDAFNRDLPYDQFIVEQLAGDLLPAGDDLSARIRHVVATGFLMVGPKALAETDKEQSRIDVVDDQIDVTGRAFLGLTIGCARCHDHKFDAIRAVDYYALAGIFRSTEHFQDEVRNASMWSEFPLFTAPGEKPYMVMAPREAPPRNLRVHLRGSRFSLGTTVPRGFLQVLSSAVPRLSPGSSGRLELARWIATPDHPLTARVLVNRVWQQHFGKGLVATSDNFGTRGESPSHPELLDWLAARFVQQGWSIKALQRELVLTQVYQQQSTTTPASRLHDPDNRWLSHFPRRRLTAEEQRDGILAVSGHLDRGGGASESADILWKEAEVQDEKRGFGPNRMQADHPFYTDFLKRSVYLPVVRNMLPDVLALFDAADPNNVTAARNETTAPSQTLFLLNNRLLRTQARNWATRLLADDKATDDDRLTRAHREAFGRGPRPEELDEAREFLEAFQAAEATQANGLPATEPPLSERRLAAWQSYCQTLLLSNEFVYLE